MNETISEETRWELRGKLISIVAWLLDPPVLYKYGAEWHDYSARPEFLDCSEWVEGVYHIAGLKDMPDGAQAQYNFTVRTETPKIGDLAFFGKEKNQDKVYHVGIIFDENLIVEMRAPDPAASFPTGEMITRPRVRWEAWKNFLCYRSHIKLV